MRNKKRTTEVEDSSSSSSSSSDSDDSDDEDDKQIKAAPVQTPAKHIPKESKTDSDSDSDSDSDDDDEQGEKRKRKRKRKAKKETPEKAAASSAPSASVTSTPSAAKPITLSPKDVGPDPNTDLRLSDQAKQAIHYAQIYTKDKSHWKFNKAKQNWLLRNALSVPPSDYGATLARKQPESSAAEEGTAEEADEAEEGENFVPDDFVPVVTAYLTSVMGGARQRMIESLREAVNAPAITVAPTQPQGADNAAAESTMTNVTADGVDGSGAVTKSVSFGNLALNAEKTEEAAEAAGLPAGTDPRAVELRRTRATQMLEMMGEAL